jgi:hypothetical protein
MAPSGWQAVLETQAFAQAAKLGPDSFAAELAVKFGNRIGAWVSAQPSQTRAVARTWVFCRNWLNLGLLHRRRLGSRRNGSGWGPRVDGNAFKQALDLGAEPGAGKIAL